MPSSLVLPEDRLNCINLIRCLCAPNPERPAVAFVGAGLSAFLGYPQWSELLECLINRAELPEDQATGATPLQVAQRCRDRLGNDDYYSFLRELFPWDAPFQLGGRSYLTHHTDLLRTGFASFLTTNYDACLDQANNARIADNLLTNDPLWRLNDLDPELLDVGRRRVFHIHGRLHDQFGEEVSDGVVLTHSDYERAYGPTQQYDGPVSEFLWRVVKRNTIVFVGCSFRDEHIERYLSALRRETEAAGGDYRHFAVVPVRHQSRPHPGMEAAEFWPPKLRPLGVLPLRYAVREGDDAHTPLGAFLRALADEAPYRAPARRYAQTEALPV